MMARRTRRVFTPAFQAEVLRALLAGNRSHAELCREHQFSPSLRTLWKDTALERLARLFQEPEQRDPQQARITELEQLVGRQALELELSKMPPGCWLAARTETEGRPELDAPRPRRAAGRCPARLPAQPSVSHAPPAPDDEAASRAAVQRLAGEWPTSGYRRMMVMLRREGWVVNSKRVRRLMTALGIHGLLPAGPAPPYGSGRSGRTSRTAGRRGS